LAPLAGHHRPALKTPVPMRLIAMYHFTQDVAATFLTSTSQDTPRSLGMTRIQ